MSISKKIDLQELMRLIDALEQVSDADDDKMSQLMDEATEQLLSEIQGDRAFEPNMRLLEEIQKFPRLSEHREDGSPSGKAIEQVRHQRREELEEFLAKHGITEESLPTKEELRLNENEWLVLAKLHKHLWNDWSLFREGCQELTEFHTISGYETRSDRRLGDAVRAIAGGVPEEDEHLHEATGTVLHRKKLSVSRNGNAVILTESEFQLVAYIARNPNTPGNEIAQIFWSDKDNPRRNFDSTLLNANAKIAPLGIRAKSGPSNYELVEHPTKTTAKKRTSGRRRIEKG